VKRLHLQPQRTKPKVSIMADNIDNLVENTKIKLLDGFSDEERSEFLSLGTVREYNLQETIISEEQDDMNIYLVTDGEVFVWRKNVPMLKYKKGDIFNETKVFFPKPNAFTVTAEKRTTIMKFSRREILTFFSLKPERLFKIFTLNIISILARKLEAYEEKLISHYYQAVSFLKGE